jgi:hypothetical protein
VIVLIEMRRRGREVVADSYFNPDEWQEVDKKPTDVNSWIQALPGQWGAHSPSNAQPFGALNTEVYRAGESIHADDASTEDVVAADAEDVCNGEGDTYEGDADAAASDAVAEDVQLPPPEAVPGSVPCTRTSYDASTSRQPGKLQLRRRGGVDSDDGGDIGTLQTAAFPFSRPLDASDDDDDDDDKSADDDGSKRARVSGRTYDWASRGLPDSAEEYLYRVRREATRVDATILTAAEPTPATAAAPAASAARAAAAAATPAPARSSGFSVYARLRAAQAAARPHPLFAPPPFAAAAATAIAGTGASSIVSANTVPASAIGEPFTGAAQVLPIGGGDALAAATALQSALRSARRSAYVGWRAHRAAAAEDGEEDQQGALAGDAEWSRDAQRLVPASLSEAVPLAWFRLQQQQQEQQRQPSSAVDASLVPPALYDISRANGCVTKSPWRPGAAGGSVDPDGPAALRYVLGTVDPGLSEADAGRTVHAHEVAACAACVLDRRGRGAAAQLAALLAATTHAAALAAADAAGTPRPAPPLLPARTSGAVWPCTDVLYLCTLKCAHNAFFALDHPCPPHARLDFIAKATINTLRPVKLAGTAAADDAPIVFRPRRPTVVRTAAAEGGAETGTENGGEVADEGACASALPLPIANDHDNESAVRIARASAQLAERASAPVGAPARMHALLQLEPVVVAALLPALAAAVTASWDEAVAVPVHGGPAVVAAPRTACDLADSFPPAGEPFTTRLDWDAASDDCHPVTVVLPVPVLSPHALEWLWLLLCAAETPVDADTASALSALHRTVCAARNALARAAVRAAKMGGVAVRIGPGAVPAYERGSAVDVAAGSEVLVRVPEGWRNALADAAAACTAVSRVIRGKFQQGAFD